VFSIHHSIRRAMVAHTLDGARRDLAIAVNLMNRSIANDMP
jgi:hypothetical protein